MKTMIKFLVIIAFIAIVGLSMTACEGLMGPEGIQGEQGEKGEQGIQGEKGEQGQPGVHGSTPWICVDGFWHIGGTPDACNANCTGIPVTFNAEAGETSLVVTNPITKAFCKDMPFDKADIVVNVKYRNILIPITNYTLLWNDSVINNGNTEITAETGNKTVYILDIAGRITEFTISVIDHEYGGWTLKTEANCAAAKIEKRNCSFCDHEDTYSVGQPDLTVHIFDWVEISEGVESNDKCQHCAYDNDNYEIIFTFEIGDKGPAGGTIFYVADGNDDRPLGFTVQGYGSPGDTGYFASYTAYYLEVAPENTSKEEMWASNDDLIPNLSQNWGDETDKAIGRGRMNTAIIIARGIDEGYSTPAASACAALINGGKNDWFLPSYNELYEIYLRRRYLSALHYYLQLSSFPLIWSSSQANNSQAMAFYTIESRYFDIEKNYHIISYIAIRAF